MSTAIAIATFAACVAGLAAAWYAHAPFKAQRAATRRQRFVEIRSSVSDLRAELEGNAADLYPAYCRDRFPGVLTVPSSIVSKPLPLAGLQIQLVQRNAKAGGRLVKAGAGLLPASASGRPFTRYSDSLAALSRPTLFEDLTCYRLLAVDLVTEPRLTLELTSYFEGVDVSELLAHELAAKTFGRGSGSIQMRDLPVRKMVVDPWELSQRPAITAISALTIRHDGSSPTFYLHQRGAGQVAMAGGLMHLAPSGVYQPSASDPNTVERDKDPWLTLCREFAEEFLGVQEARGDAGASLSYDEDEPYASINDAYKNGSLRVSILCVGLSPLTLCPELIVVAVIDADTFDNIFDAMVRENDEGVFRGSRVSAGKLVGFAFDEATIRHLTSNGSLSPAATTALARAWALRRMLIPQP